MRGRESPPRERRGSAGLDLQALPARRPGGQLSGGVNGADRHGLRDRARARGPDPRHRPAPRGDPRLHRTGQAPLPDSPAHPRPGFGGAGRDDRGARDHAVPTVGRAPQRVLRGPQGQPAGSGAPATTTPGSPGCAASRPRPVPRPLLSPAIPGMEASPRSCRWPAGRAPRCGTTSLPGASIITRSTTGATRRSAAPRALVPPRRARASEPGAGGGKGDSDKECLLHPPLESGSQANLRGSPVSAPMGGARSTSRP